MEISRNKLLITLLVGMRGCITPNLRAASVDYGSEHITLFFYYETQPTEEEELAEEIATDVISAFPEVLLHAFEVRKTVYSYPKKIPNDGFIVYLRYEPTPKEKRDGRG